MLPRALADYGAPYSNEAPVEDVTTEIDAPLFNKLAGDACQLTRVTSKVLLHFATVASGNATATYTDTIWGAGAAYYPTTITRTAPGTYLITYPTTFLDDSATAESVTFIGGDGTIQSIISVGSVQLIASSNTIAVATINSGGSVADLTNGTIVRIDVR